MIFGRGENGYHDLDALPVHTQVGNPRTVQISYMKYGGFSCEMREVELASRRLGRIRELSCLVV